MGNNPSRSSTTASGGSAPQSPSSHVHSTSSNAQHNAHNHSRREPRRRDSIQALSSTKATAAPPSASIESVAGRISATSQRIAPTPQLKPADSHSPTPDKMGNDGSKPERPRSASSARHRPSPAVHPVDVPTTPSHAQDWVPSPIDPNAPAPEQSYLPPSQFSRAPRLPLPIEEETHTPGSPIITPADLRAPVEPVHDGAPIQRGTSVLSSTTVDEDDIGDTPELQHDLRPTVPTVVEWRGNCEKPYVTGTFVNWERKLRLHKDGPSKNPDAYSTTINLLPGTHYLKFIIGGDMCTSDHLPTTVDYTNILVNYIEVSPDDVPTPPPSEPVPIPGKEAPSDPPKPEEIPPDLHPPQVLPPQFHTPPAPTPAPAASAPEQSTPKQMAETAAPVEKGPTKQYHSDIPRFLLDLDAPEESSRFHRANAVVSTLPAPPSLPGFLGKSILNGSTPMKDDSSVLNMPNHTVLNHLATSSIKANVLATSATTRYRKKFLTTIMYKPTSDDGP